MALTPLQGQATTNSMLLPSLHVSPAAARGKGVEDCLQKVREAERSLQRSLHLARAALSSLTDNQTPQAQHEPLVEEFKKPAPNRAESAVSHNTVATNDSKTLPDRSKAQTLFNSADTNNSGTVGILELRKLFDEMRETPLTDAEFEDLKMKVVNGDKDADGELSFEEFYKLLCNQQGSKKDGKTQVRELQKAAMQASQQERMSPEQFVQIRGVAPSAVTRYLRKELDETSACLQLPWAALIFLFYFLAVRTHFDLDRLHAVDHSITWDIQENANFAFTGIVPFENGRMGHKNIEDVNSIADFWSFLNMGIVPIFWPQGWDVNEARVNTMAFCQGQKGGLESWGGYHSSKLSNMSSHWHALPGDCPETGTEVQFREDTRQFFGHSQVKMEGTYLLFHRIVAGVRMRQERVGLADCPERSLQNMPGKCTTNPDFWLKPEIQRSLSINDDLLNRPGGETVHLLSNTLQDDVRNELRKLENKAWFSPQTRKIQLLFTTYNMNEDMLTATYILFFLNRGGHIFKNVEPVSFYLDPYHGTWIGWVFDICWAVLCAKLLLEETWEILKHWKQLGMGKGSMIYMNLANAIDWISIGFTFYLIISWTFYLANLGEIRKTLGTADLTIQGSWNTAPERDHFYNLVDQAVSETHDLRTALALYPFVIVSRFFKAFSSQPRLAMVTKTFAKASVDIFHFGVVFFTVFIIFAFSAMILWGQELEEFANYGRAFHTSFRILLGDFEWEPLTSIGRTLAYFWFWSFVWLVNLIMLNMLLAIIMDVYTDVKSGSADAETLWSQTVEIFYRAKDVWAGKTLPLGTVLAALDPTDLDDGDEAEEQDDEPLFVSSLMEKVPKMSEEQSFHLLLESQKLKMSDERDSDTMSEALIRIQDIDERTKLLQEHIVRLIQVQGYNRFGESGSTYF